MLKNFPTLAAQIGDPLEKTDKAMLKANSPIENLERFNVPVLVVHGSHDTYVNITNVHQFERKMRGKKNPIEYVQLDAGGHFINGQKNRIELFEAIDKFLNKHLD